MDGNERGAVALDPVAPYQVFSVVGEHRIDLNAGVGDARRLNGHILIAAVAFFIAVIILAFFKR
ncbi:MAG: hypothetical protein IJQ33_00980 [Clostridia bacterium]|nr:hypothetical protein [Clostridia bacterium]